MFVSGLLWDTSAQVSFICGLLAFFSFYMSQCHFTFWFIFHTWLHYAWDYRQFSYVAVFWRGRKATSWLLSLETWLVLQCIHFVNFTIYVLLCDAATHIPSFNCNSMNYKPWFTPFFLLSGSMCFWTESSLFFFAQIRELSVGGIVVGVPFDIREKNPGKNLYVSFLFKYATSSLQYILFT